MTLSERQQQALRGLRLAEIELQDRSAEKDFTPREHAWWFVAGRVAAYIQDELPRVEQHGNGAMSKRSWSGLVPYARFMGPALRALERKGLAECMAYWMRHDARSDAFRITDKGREEADRLLAEKGTA